MKVSHDTVAWDYFITCRCAGVRDAQDRDTNERHALDCPYHGCYRYGCVPGELHQPDCPTASRNPSAQKRADAAEAKLARVRQVLKGAWFTHRMPAKAEALERAAGAVWKALDDD